MNDDESIEGGFGLVYFGYVLVIFWFWFGFGSGCGGRRVERNILSDGFTPGCLNQYKIVEYR